MRDHHPEHVWAWAKADYQQGLAVGLICSGYNLARSTFYDRARREGWLRGEDAHAAEQTGELKPTPPPAPSLLEMARQALDQAAAAIAAGDERAANGWLRAVKRLRALAIEEVAPYSGWTTAKERLAEAVLAPPVDIEEVARAEARLEHAVADIGCPGQPEPSQPQAAQGIASGDPDSPDKNISGDRSTRPPPVTDAEIAAAEAEFRRLTAGIDTTGLESSEGFGAWADGP